MGGFAAPAAAIAAVGAAALGAYGQIESSQAAAGAAHYNAAIANRNSLIAARNAAIVMESGEAQAGLQGQKTRAQVGEIKAGQAASGVESTTGSATQTQLSQRELGELDAKNIRMNAIREAYGLNVQSANYAAEGTLKEKEAQADITSGEIGAASTFLSGASSAGSKFAQFQIQSGGFGEAASSGASGASSAGSIGSDLDFEG